MTRRERIVRWAEHVFAVYLIALPAIAFLALLGPLEEIGLPWAFVGVMGIAIATVPISIIGVVWLVDDFPRWGL